MVARIHNLHFFGNRWSPASLKSFSADSAEIINIMVDNLHAFVFDALLASLMVARILLDGCGHP